MHAYVSPNLQETFPYTHGTGTADATVVDGYVSLGFSIKRGIVDREKGVEGPLLVRINYNRLDKVRLGHGVRGVGSLYDAFFFVVPWIVWFSGSRFERPRAQSKQS